MSGDSTDPTVISVSDLRDEGHADFDPEADDTYTFQTDFTATYKTYAKGLYDSPRDTIRELASNSTAALDRAVESLSLTKEEAVIEITLDRDERMLSVRDNGDGITENDIDEIMTKLNRSASFLNPDRPGQFGVGFLSTFMLVDLEGAFLMYSRPRTQPNTQLKGTWHGGRGFKSRPNLTGGLPEDEYGVLFQFPLASSIDMDAIQQWVADVCSRCEWSVYYEEIEGDVRENEEYGAYDPTEKYRNDIPVLSVDTEYFEAYNTEDALSEFTLINAPISFSWGKRALDLPFENVDIRFNYESGVVVDGPHEGLIPVEFDYSSIPESERDRFIKQSELSDEDVVMPKPTQGRSRLRERSEFADWLQNQFWREYERQLLEVFSEVSTIRDLFHNPYNQVQLAFSSMGVTWDDSDVTRNPDELEAKLDDVADYPLRIPDPVKDALPVFQKRIEFYQKGFNFYEDGIQASAFVPAYLAEITGATVYMMVSENQRKAEVIWEDNDDNVLVKVEKSDDYELFESFGWKKLKSVKASTIESFDVSEKTINEWKSQTRTRKTMADRDLLIHFGNSHHKKHDWNVDELREALETIENNPDLKKYEYPEGLEDVERLVLFPTDTDRKISDWYDMSTKKIGIATCINKTYDYLAEASERVVHIDEYVGAAESTRILTSEGELSVGEIEPDELTLHIVPDDAVEDFRMSAEAASRAHTGIILQAEEKSYTSGLGGRKDDVYVPLTFEEYEQIRPAIHGAQMIVGSRYSDRMVGVTRLDNHTGAYAHAMLPSYVGSPILDALVKTKAPLFPDGKALVDELRETNE